MMTRHLYERFYAMEETAFIIVVYKKVRASPEQSVNQALPKNTRTKIGRDMEEVKRPVVSVVVPVYNTEPFVAECLQSLEKQTLTDIEIILVKDGSTDNSGRLLREYAGKDARFVFMWNRRIEGLSAARNTGMEHASGHYLAFLEQLMTGWQRMLCRCYVRYCSEDPVKTLSQEIHWQYIRTGRCEVGKEGAGSCLRREPWRLEVRISQE